MASPGFWYPGNTTTGPLPELKAKGRFFWCRIHWQTSCASSDQQSNEPEGDHNWPLLHEALAKGFQVENILLSILDMFMPCLDRFPWRHVLCSISNILDISDISESFWHFVVRLVFELAPQGRIEDFEINDKSCLDRGNGKSRHIHVDPFLQHFQLLFTTLTLIGVWSALLNATPAVCHNLMLSFCQSLACLGVFSYYGFFKFLQSSMLFLTHSRTQCWHVPWVLLSHVQSVCLKLSTSPNHLSLSERSWWLYKCIAKEWLKTRCYNSQTLPTAGAQNWGAPWQPWHLTSLAVPELLRIWHSRCYRPFEIGKEAEFLCLSWSDSICCSMVYPFSMDQIGTMGPQIRHKGA